MFSALTTRGRSFLAAGGAAAVCGLALSEPDLLRVGALLIVLPLFSALAASRARYRLTCTRRVIPARVPAGQSAQVSLRLVNAARLRTGLLLAEDTTPYALGSRPRFVLDEIEPGGSRDLTYQICSQARGKFTIGPLQVRVADAFGLVEIGRSFSSSSTLVVTPKITALPRAAIAGSWLGDGESGMRAISAAGEDDIAPRAYRDGDGLRRVHWRSTARYGELMVRREEQQRRNSAALFIDTRRGAHAGSGAESSFEFAVSAAASIGVYLTGEGRDARLITDAGEVSPQGSFHEMLLDTLAVIRPSSGAGLRGGLAALAGGTGGQVIAIMGRLTPDQAKQLAASNQGSAPAMALLLAVSTWGEQRAPRLRLAAERLGSEQTRDEADVAARILAGAGWRVARVTADTPLAAAWEQLHRSTAGAAVPLGTGAGS
jgi:uncharacterized protein (DUF58 family)